MLRHFVIIGSCLISSVGFAVTDADIINAEGHFNENMKNVDFVKNHIESVGANNGIPLDNGNNTTPGYGEPEAWNDLVVAFQTLQTVSNNVQATIPTLKFWLFNFPVFTIRHTALCTQLTQVNTAWTSLEFADSTTLPFNQRLGAKFYQDDRSALETGIASSHYF
ncbi:hypothetical protein EBR21_16375 [bacterium]|nr:hypothetical protein [bacterium]